MLALPSELIHLYETQLLQHGVQAPQRPYYLKWMRYYCDFCHNYAWGAMEQAKKESDRDREHDMGRYS